MVSYIITLPLFLDFFCLGPGRINTGRTGASESTLRTGMVFSDGKEQQNSYVRVIAKYSKALSPSTQSLGLNGPRSFK